MATRIAARSLFRLWTVVAPLVVACIGRWSLALAAVIGAVACGGYDDGKFIASDGQTLPQASYSEWEPPIRWSGAHDLACPLGSVTAQRLTRDLFAADGCGQRATYAIRSVVEGQRIVLIAKVALDSVAAGLHSVPPAAPP